MNARIQGVVEDLLAHLGVGSYGAYAIQVAEVHRRLGADPAGFEAGLRKLPAPRLVGTTLSKNELISLLVDRLRPTRNSPPALPARRIRRPPESQAIRRASRNRAQGFNEDLSDFARHVHDSEIGQFWASRKDLKLVDQAERVGQGLLSTFLKGRHARAHVVRELRANVGFIDVSVIAPTGLRIVELKVVRRGGLTGLKQLANYLKSKGETEGWLVVFDARKSPKRRLRDHDRKIGDALVHVTVIDINPLAPHRLG